MALKRREWGVTITVRVLVVLWLAAFIGIVMMHASFGSPEREAWFKSLMVPGTMMSCCDVADCKRVEARYQAGQWHIVQKDGLTPVPPRVVLTKPPTIDGEAYACMAPQDVIRCFIPPLMGL